MTKIAVIGSGPAGLMAALHAVQPGNEVSIFDSNEHVGRKLLVTGAGRCNLTNSNVAAVRYACDNPVWLNEVLNQFSRENLLSFLDTIGVPTFSTFDGWYYPVSESAHAVVDAFDAALDEKHVRKIMKKLVTGVRVTDQGFNIILHRDTILVERVVITCGGRAYPSLGSDGNLFRTIEELGHKLHPILPALAPVTADMRSLKALLGVRLDADVSLIQAGRTLGKTFGNVIFTDWGLNGPGVMDLSYLISLYGPREMTLELNFLHKFEEKIRELFTGRKSSSLTILVAIQSILPPKMAQYILARNGIPPATQLSKLTTSMVDTILDQLTAFHLSVTGTRGFDHCQVSAGGVPLDEVDPRTMESIVVPGLFFAGEVLDVTGPCGGYNLQFAFSTGAIAGMGAAQKPV